jgi:hypothetical protein
MMHGALQELLQLIEAAFPVPGRFRPGLPGDVAELSRLLTRSRSDRKGGYLNQPKLLSAYLRYFLPWNVFRLHRLFSFGAGGPSTAAGEALPLGLTGGSAITDIGSGPLTLPAALWLFRPELRGLNLEFRCVDKSGSALEAGKQLLGALAAAGGGGAWKIRTIHGPLDTPIRGEGAALVTAVNVFNEVYRFDDSPRELSLAGERAAELLERSSAREGSILVMEPGVPGSGAFIAALRNALLKRGRKITAPCTHGGPCPLPGEGRGGEVPPGSRAHSRPFPGPAAGGRRTAGGRAKWCHFAFDTTEAPVELHRLSAAAGIPKERAAFSFLLAGPAGKAPELPGGETPDPPVVRILSDPFPLREFSAAAGRAGQWGRYGCSDRGLVLVAGNRDETERAGPGTMGAAVLTDLRDPKTGAPVAALPFL